MDFFKKERFKILCFALPFLLIIFSTGLNYDFQGDERGFFIPVIKQFGENWLPSLSTLRSYPVPQPPLPFLIFGIFGKLFDFNLKILRLFNMCISFAAIVVFYRVMKRISDHAFFLTSLLLLFPYYIVLTSSLVYTEPISFLFVVLALYYYLYKEGNLLGGFFAGCAVLCRQYYIFLPVTFIIIEIFRKKEKAFINARNIVNFALPFCMYLPFVIFWGGMVPIGNPATPSLMNFSTFNYTIIMLGVYSIPILMFSYKSLFNNFILKSFLSLLAMPVFFFGSPEQANIGISGTGPLFRFGFSFGPYSRIIFMAAFLLGIFVLLTLLLIKLRDFNKVDSYCIYGTYFFCFMMLFAPFTWEKYILTIYPLLIMFFGRRMNKNIYLMIMWLAVFSIISIYSFWHFLLLHPL